MGITLSVICCLFYMPFIDAESISFVTSAQWSLDSFTVQNQNNTTTTTTSSSSHSSSNGSWRGNGGIKAHWRANYVWSSSGQNDLDININITLNEVARGARRLLDSSLLPSLCPLTICSLCGGKGILHTHETLGNSVLIESASYPCPACAGWGKMPTKRDCLHLTRHDSSRDMSDNSQSNKYELTVDILKLFIPPNTSKGDTVLYRPFESTFIQRVPTNQSSDNRTSSQKASSSSSHNKADFGPIRIIIESIQLPSTLLPFKIPQHSVQDLALQSTTLSVEEKNFRLIIPISPMEATFGFSRSFNLFREFDDRNLEDDSMRCDDLRIHREGKPTLPDSSVSLPLQLLYQQLCMKGTNVSEVEASIDRNEYLFPYNYPMNREKQADDIQQPMLYLQFQVLNASTYQDSFMQYWNCSIIEIIEPLEYYEVLAEDDEVIDLDNPTFNEPPPPPPEPVVRREISCGDTEFENERTNMFIAIQSSQENDKKYHSWLDFLKRT